MLGNIPSLPDELGSLQNDCPDDPETLRVSLSLFFCCHMKDDKFLYNLQVHWKFSFWEKNPASDFFSSPVKDL